jgi:hypothetical protein
MSDSLAARSCKGQAPSPGSGALRAALKGPVAPGSRPINVFDKKENQFFFFSNTYLEKAETDGGCCSPDYS